MLLLMEILYTGQVEVERQKKTRDQVFDKTFIEGPVLQKRSTNNENPF